MLLEEIMLKETNLAFEFDHFEENVVFERVFLYLKLTKNGIHTVRKTLLFDDPSF